MLIYFTTGLGHYSLQSEVTCVISQVLSRGSDCGISIVSDPLFGDNMLFTCVIEFAVVFKVFLQFLPRGALLQSTNLTLANFAIVSFSL